ncbi:STAS domain-containing protein [Limnohabitans lacus]|jgi:phospholipid transport system transporter-binding protein|uniref:STAS domain-containing protein n=1 Tax=Limnohabitans lacus TaxID=3045173 RepID=A0ABT6X6M8_9BURK|nr:STAS domain-containing protein [Limnohabitans sp. HM2-2]MDI9233774.1 STAS domain-containing protein [Limnohabitans sp. HM2-2]
MEALKLPPTLMHEHADACLSQWVSQLQGKVRPVQPEPVLVDASALSVFDSSALAVLLGLRRVAKAQGRSVLVEGMSDRLRELATLYGVLDLLEPA